MARHTRDARQLCMALGVAKPVCAGYRLASFVAEHERCPGRCPGRILDKMVFSFFRRQPQQEAILPLYNNIVVQVREPLFYRDLGVPDTVNGRFDLLVLHLWMILRRLKLLEGGARLCQALFDCFCDDMDGNLREMGVGDLTVPKRMQAFGEAFYGRTAAYDLALSEGADALAQALCRNILNGEQIENARRLARYTEAAMAALAALDDAALRSASFNFPPPARMSALP
jgi:cytochrome b pre-mRNA-processing protein 3